MVELNICQKNVIKWILNNDSCVIDLTCKKDVKSVNELIEKGFVKEIGRSKDYLRVA